MLWWFHIHFCASNSGTRWWHICIVQTTTTVGLMTALPFLSATPFGSLSLPTLLSTRNLQTKDEQVGACRTLSMPFANAQRNTDCFSYLHKWSFELPCSILNTVTDADSNSNHIARYLDRIRFDLWVELSENGLNFVKNFQPEAKKA